MADPTSMSRSRRSELNGAKLRGLLREHLSVDAATSVETMPFGDGAGTVVGEEAWVLHDSDEEHVLGAALAWAVRRGAASLHVIGDSGGGLIARRAAGFDVEISVWAVAGRSLVPIVPTALGDPRPPSVDHLAFADLIEAAGATVSVEHGVVSGEVRGLEVCRVVDDPTTGFLGDIADTVRSGSGGMQLEVGVGPADREAFQILHGDLPTVDALASVVDAVVRHRRAEAPQHPLNRLARERYLRWHAIDSPASVGASALFPVEPPVPRRNLKDPVPCVAEGRTEGDEPVRIVFSSGVDLEVLPFAVDATHGFDGRVVLAMPGRDVVPVQRELADRLVRPIEFLPLTVGTA